MSWQTNSVTFVSCDDRHHTGDAVAKIETAFNITAGTALAAMGWSYNHKRGVHRCPACTALLTRRN